jgi:hypothetical protein
MGNHSGPCENWWPPGFAGDGAMSPSLNRLRLPVVLNHPGFDAHRLRWEGGIYAEQVRRADPR